MLTKTTKRITNIDVVVDKFNFQNHVDKWCQEYCNLINAKKLDKVKGTYMHSTSINDCLMPISVLL